MKRIVKHTISAALFMAMLAGGLYGLSRLFAFSSNGVLTDAIYQYGDGSFDVIFVGPSTTQHAVYPMQLWEEYGITSYDLASASQTIPESYYVAKEAVRSFHPRILAVDAGTCDRNEKVSSLEHLHLVTDQIPITSPVRWEMGRDLGGREFLQFVMPLLAYHTRWKGMTKAEVRKDDRTVKEMAFGTLLNPIRRKGREYADNPPAADTALSKWPKYYLRKLMELCRETGTELVFFTTPTVYQGAISQASYDARREAYQALAVMAGEEGIPFLDYFTRGAELGIIPTRDSMDGHHLNYWGARKFTAFLGQYLHDSFQLPDHRADSSCTWMAEAYEYYSHARWERMLKKAISLDVYFDLLEEAFQSEDYLAVMVMQGTAAAPLGASEARSVQQSGALQSLYHYGDYSYVAVIDRGVSLCESDIRSRARSEEYHVEADGIRIDAIGTSGTEGALVRIDDVDMSPDRPGLTVVVYDKANRRMLDRVTINLDLDAHELTHAE